MLMARIAVLAVAQTAKVGGTAELYLVTTTAAAAKQRWYGNNSELVGCQHSAQKQMQCSNATPRRHPGGCRIAAPLPAVSKA
jgi:hypothetical protein